MKFGDKLIVLRKKNGLSQEELAEKLGVSRQSVSKWESNNTYPETDKIVQIANLFECSMDDLINDKVTDVEGSLRKNKNNLNEVWDSLLDFISRTVNMFSHMKFGEGLKCFVEMFIVGFLLWLIGIIVCSITSSVIANLFSFCGANVTNTLESILNSIFDVFWFILAVIVLIHTFKIRYLNYYEMPEEKESKDNNKSEKANTEKVIIRDEKDKPFAFLSVLSKIIIWFIKFIVFWIAFSVVFVIIGLAIASIISLALIPTNLLFVGSSLALVSSVVIAVLFLLLCIYFIISKKINVNVFVITFITAVVLCGVGIGISAISIKNFDVIKSNDNKNISTEELVVEYEDNLVIMTHDFDEIDQYTYIADDTIPADTIILDISYDPNTKKINKESFEEDYLNVLKISGEFKNNPKEIYKSIIKDMKDNKIVIDHLNSAINGLTIKANSETINKLISNTEKLYILEKETEENITKVKMHGDKVYIYGGGAFVEYNAINDELIYTEIAPKNFNCSRTVRKSTYGDRIYYNCLDYDEDFDEDEDYYEDYDE